ncbi:MAG: hypothetical protein RLZZ157_1497 [Pseudomonadota bacterium]|jgi:CubicO group peptidase (beta-lactamase class C family)
MNLKSLFLSLALVFFAPPAKADTSSLLDLVAQEHVAGRFNGAIVLLKGGEIVFSTGIGKSDQSSGARWSSTTVTRYASVTKQVTALLVLQEVANGRLKLDAPLAQYFPDAPVSVKAVTIEQLLRHTSGIREKDEDPTGQFTTSYPYRAPTTPRARQRPLAMAKAICSEPLAALPGKTFAYGDCEYFWLGAVLEKVTKTKFYNLVHDRIAKPNNFSSWGGFVPGKAVSSAIGYVGAGEREPDTAIWAFSSAAGLYGHLEDLVRFERLLISSALLRADLTDLMLTGIEANQSHAMGSWSYSIPDASGTHIRYVERQGWVGGIRLSVMSVPAQDIVLAMVSNAPATNFDGAWNPDGFVGRMMAEALKQ